MYPSPKSLFGRLLREQKMGLCDNQKFVMLSIIVNIDFYQFRFFTKMLYIKQMTIAWELRDISESRVDHTLPHDQRQSGRKCLSTFQNTWHQNFVRRTMFMQYPARHNIILWHCCIDIKSTSFFATQKSRNRSGEWDMAPNLNISECSWNHYKPPCLNREISEYWRECRLRLLN